MKLKYFFFLLFLFSLFIGTENIFARAGGEIGDSDDSYSYSDNDYDDYGSYSRLDRKSGAVAGILMAFTLVCVIIIFSGIFILTRLKDSKTKKYLDQAQKYDPVWDEEKIMAHAKQTFAEVQKAWSENDLSSIRHLLTTHFYETQQNFLNRYKKMRVKNKVSEIEFSKWKVVSVIDKKDNDLDMFAVYFSGTMIDYLYSEIHQTVLSGDENYSSKFEDVYVFYRKNDHWLLNQIINSPTKVQLLKYKLEIEK